MYIPEQENEVFAAAADEAPHSTHCWCNRTLTEVGVDDQLAGIQDCNPTRPCFEE
jgi:hypothetical protein